MKVKLSKGHSISQEAVKKIEIKLDIKLPNDYKDFLLKNDGAIPSDNIFEVNANIDSGVNGFIPLDQVNKEMRKLDSVYFSKVVPIAWAEGGNYIYMSLIEKRGIYFWDHEEPHKVYHIASCFDDFLNLLKPFDIDSIELKEGQVKSAWIDPDFLKSLNY